MRVFWNHVPLRRKFSSVVKGEDVVSVPARVTVRSSGFVKTSPEKFPLGTRVTGHSRFSVATNVNWKDKDSGEYKTRPNGIESWSGRNSANGRAVLRRRFYRSRRRTAVLGVSAQRFRREDPHRRDPRDFNPDALIAPRRLSMKARPQPQN
jgi:hypothetical protein